ncbi:LysE family translocator [Nocardia sp. bgisy134]|uniref:LysE family translocator n=1 Tax=Nocardia sp. bgisy134 TaxID=3413789 RepID=UPI003D738AED
MTCGEPPNSKPHCDRDSRRRVAWIVISGRARVGPAEQRRRGLLLAEPGYSEVNAICLATPTRRARCDDRTSAAVVSLLSIASLAVMEVGDVRHDPAVYLIWLGGSAIWKSLPRNRAPGIGENTATAPMATRATEALRAGAITNLLNPKVGVFYISILPQFLPVGSATAASGAVLVGIHIAVTFLWYPALIWTASKARHMLLRERVRAWMDRISATVLIGVGLKLAVQTR